MSNYFIPNIGKLTLTNKNYLAEGGEAKIYVVNNRAIKIYHDALKAIPEAKIQELSLIKDKNVLKPLSVVYDSYNKNVGFMMDFVTDGVPLCKLFTKTFKTNQNISEKDIIDLVKNIQLTVQNIHNDKCVIADLNELNILVKDSFKNPIFIDVDSYQTANFPATAIMDSVRDRIVPFGTFNENTDWFAFAVLAFQLYIGIHPYKGKHPNYKPSEWQKRMDDGVSVFNRDVTLPDVCNKFSVIPKRHLDWFQNVFVKNERSVPPIADSLVPMAVPSQIVFIKGGDGFDVEKVLEASDTIIDVIDIMGIKYVQTKSGIYSNGKKIVELNKKTIIGSTLDMDVMICEIEGQNVYIRSNRSSEKHHIKAKDVMYRNKCIYSIYDDKLIESGLKTLPNGKVICDMRTCASVSSLTAKIFDGVVYQDLLGKSVLTIPYSQGLCVNVMIPELDKHRIIDIKMIDNFCVINAERKNIYHRFVLIFDGNYTKYSIRKIEAIDYDAINFTVLKGICALLNTDGELELFKEALKVKAVSNAPFDSSMKLVTLNDKVHFINGKFLYKVSTK